MTSEEDGVRGWQLRSATQHEGFPVTQWWHDSGAWHVHWERPDTEQAFGISFDTPAADDSGAAHVLEHWIGAGSVAYPMSSALLTAHHRCGSGFLNGFTETGRTACTYTADTPRDHLALLEVVLDAVYHPLLTDGDFLREGCRASGETAWSGIVFNEMSLKMETEAQWVSRLLARYHEPRGHRQYRHEGVPSALVMLTAERARDFHRRYYRPERAFSFFVGSGDDQTRLVLDAAHHARRAEPIPPRTSGTETALLHAPSRLRDQVWIAATLSWDSSRAASWAAAFDTCEMLRTAWRATGSNRTVSGPVSLGDEVVVAAAVPADSEQARPREAQAQDLLEAIAALVGKGTGQAESRPLGSRFSQPYQSLPRGIGWGLSLSAARAERRDLADAHTVLPDDRPAPRLRSAVLDPVGQVVPPPGPPAASRTQADDECWAAHLTSQDASCLPISPVPEPRADEDAKAEAVAPRVYLIRTGPPGVYGHIAVRVEPELWHLVYPLTRLLETFLGTRLSATDPARVRGDGAGPVIDLLYSGWNADTWRDQLARFRDLLKSPVGAAQLDRCVRALLHQGSGRLLVAPQELAESAALAAVSPAGATQDAVSGLSALVAWRALMAEANRGEQMATALDALAGTPVELVVVGTADLGRAETLLAPSPPHAQQRAGGPAVHTPVRVGQGRDHFAHAVAWPIPPGADPATAAVLACDLRRRIAHRVVRERDGAYGAYAYFDPFREGICLWTQADPVGPSRVEQLLDHVAHRYCPPNEDDLNTARVMAARAFTGAPQSLADVVRRLPATPALVTRRGLMSVSATDLVTMARTHLTAELGRGFSID